VAADILPAAMPSKRLVAIALLVAASLTTACVAFPAYPIQEDRAGTRLPGRLGGAAQLEVSILRYLNGRPRQVPEKQQRQWREFAAQACIDLGALDRIGPEPAERKVQVIIRDEGRASRPLLTLSALSLFLIPSGSRSDFTVTVRVQRTADLAVLGEATTRYSYRSWYHLFLLPFVGTNQEMAVESEVIYGLARKGLAEALGGTVQPID
jgi:hypothetical protein